MDYRNYKLEKSIGHQIARTGRLVTNRLNTNFKNGNYPVTHEQWSIMIRLWEEDGLTQNRLAELTHKDNPCVSRLINNLEKRELVKRTTHPVDGRTKLIYLTEKGREMQIGLIQQAQKTVEQISDGIAPDELVTFLRVLTKIQENLT